MLEHIFVVKVLVNRNSPSSFEPTCELTSLSPSGVGSSISDSGDEDDLQHDEEHDEELNFI